MIIAGIIILCFTFIQLLIAIANIIFYQSIIKYNDSSNDLVSVLIPARNEEANIGKLLADLQKQDYRNIDVIVFNDQSTDNTERIIRQFTEKSPVTRYINSAELPDGWLGKNYACHSLSAKAKGKYFLFLDADVRVGKHIIKNALAFIKHHKLGLLSVFPQQVMKSPGEWITVPNMNIILLSLLPLILVRKSPLPSLAAANGQFMFFDAHIYRNIKPHLALRNNKVEDIEIAKLYKNNAIKVACLTGNDEITCRMYNSFKDAVHGFSKNVIMFFGSSFLVALLYWLITTFGFFVILLYFPTPVFYIYLAAWIITRILISIISRQSVLLNLAFAVPQQISMGLFILTAFRNKLLKKHTWKGRNTY